MAKLQWTPDQQDGPFRRWNIPAQAWSKAEYGEDTLRIFHNAETGEWWGDTEHDQCCHRSLTAEELTQAREELGIE